MPKTLIITLEYPPQIGGVASYVYNLAQHLPAEQVIVYAPKKPQDVQFDKINPWKTIRGKPFFSFIWPHWLRLLFLVLKIVKSEKIEMIYVNHALPVGYVAYIINKIQHVPYIIFLHGTDLEMGTKNNSKKRKLKKVCGHSAKVVVNSHFLKNKFKARFEDLNKNIEVVYPCPNEIFLKPILPEELKKLKSQLALEGKRVIITVARMAEGKGYPHLIRLLPKILEKIPNLVWLIIGEGPKKSEIITAIQKNNLQNVSRFIGPVPYGDLPKYYQVSDLLVLLTHPDESTEEGWGTVFMEAAASGLPVVAGRAGGIEESVQNLITGLVVDVYQDQSVVSAVVDLLREREYAKKMGEAGRQRILQEFNWAEQIKKI